EAYEMYQALLGRIQSQVARTLFLVPQAVVQPRRPRSLQAVRPGVGVVAPAQPSPARGAPGGLRPRSAPAPAGAKPQPRPTTTAPAATAPHKLSRNDPCWCGSGKKYKNCHWRQDLEAGRVPVAVPSPPSQPSGSRRKKR
ncbi:MAG: SEC-C domain-containing protein, partial [Anaerolineae bacterium]|nr:SEC-C domain-containing protein [Anaerolineae bacterium]